MKKAILLFLILLIGVLTSGCGKEDTADTQGTVSEISQSAEDTGDGTSSGGMASVTIPGLDGGGQTRETAGDGTQAADAGWNEGDTFASTGIPAVALTFDDGPQKNSTDAILDVLEEYGAHATFFIVGANIYRNPSALKREAELGCELGTHTYSHTQLTTLTLEEVQKELDDSVAMIEDTSGSTVTCIRPPYGALNDEIKEALQLPIVLWSIDTLDWETRDPDNTLKEVQENVQGGSIILMHDVYTESAEAVEMIVPWLVENGYRLLTVSELYEYYGEELTLHKAHGRAQ